MNLRVSETEMETLKIDRTITLKFCPLSERDAGILVVACDEKGNSLGRGSLIVFNRDGTIFRCPNVDEGIGFRLDDVGRIKYLSERAEELRDKYEDETNKQRILDFVASFIDSVEDKIRERYPEIEKIGSKAEGNTLLHGDDYYSLEDDLIARTKEILNESKKP